MTETKQISHQQAVKIDTQLAELWGKQSEAFSSLQRLSNDLTNETFEWRHRPGKYDFISLDDLIFRARVILAWGELPGYEADAIKRSLDRLSQVKHDLYVLKQQIAVLEAQFSANPWSRFFLVQNHGGHIHSSMHCSTCRPTTSFGWLPNLSGLTEKDAVDAHGTILCSVCFPTAPVEWTLGKQEEVDLNQCPGSGTFDHTDNRRMGWSGNGRATCNHCHQRIGTTSTGKLRKHKKEGR